MIDRYNLYREHVVHSSIKEATDILKKLLDNFLDNVAYGEVVNRSMLIVTSIKDILATGNIEFVRLSWLDNINSYCINIRDNAINFESSENLSYIDSIDSTTDELLEYLFRLNSVNKMSLDVHAAYSEYVERYQQRVRDLIDCIDETETQLSELQEIVGSNKTTSDTRLEELSNKITQEQQRLDSFATSYQQQMSDDKESFLNFKSELNQQFAGEKKSWDDSISSLITEGKNLQGDFVTSTKEQFEKIEKEKNEIIDNYKASFSHYEEEVEKLVGIISANTFSSKYREVADDAKNRAFKWHIIAVVAMICVALFAVYAFMCTTTNDTSWVKLAAKIFATGTLATIAAYAVSEANKQGKVERYARKIEMELVAIDPFIESLDEEKKTEIKKSVAEKIFNQPDDMGITKDDENYEKRLEKTSVNLLAEIFSTINKIK